MPRVFIAMRRVDPAFTPAANELRTGYLSAHDTIYFVKKLSFLKKLGARLLAKGV